MSKLEKNFLIRSAGQILGPFSKEEVVDLIKRGKISIFDEVAEPFTIWWYLQDHKDFKKIVHSVDVQTRLTNFLTQISGKISTMSKTEKIEGKTLTNTVSEASDQMKKTELGDRQKISKLDSHEKQLAHEVKFEVLNQPKKPSQPYAKYTSQRDSEEIIRKRISSILKISWYLVVIFALCVGAHVFYKEAIIPIQQKNKVVEEFQTKGLKFYKAGNYKQALPYFEEAYAKDILQEDEKLLLASLFFQEGKSQKAFLIANELSNNSSLLKSGNWFLLSGLVSFFQKNFPKAEKNFNLALEQKNHIALVNLSLLKWHSGDYKKSLFYLDQLVKAGYERDIIFYLRALNLLSQNQISELTSYISQELSLNQESRLIEEYKQEFYFMLAYAHMKTQNLEELKKAVQNLLNEDPFFYTEYQYSSFIPVRTLNWNSFYPYCKSIFDSDPKNSLLNALYGFCYLKAGHIKEGAKYIKQAKNRKADEPLFMSLYAYLLMLQEKDFQMEQALSLIDYDSLKQEQTLPFILKARFFEKKQDWARALAAWKGLLSLDVQQLSGIAGVAVASYNLGDDSTADIYRNRGLGEYPYYVRLLSYEKPDF